MLRIFNLFLFLAMTTALSWLHITDLHVDMKYTPYTPSKCEYLSHLGTMCCRKFDIPLNDSGSCSKFGDLNDDIPPEMVINIFQWIQDRNMTFDFVVNTGDDASHKDIEQVFTDDNKQSIDFVSRTTNEFFLNTSIYRAIGNHDAFPNVDQTFPGYGPFLKDISRYWVRDVKDENLPKYGYFSVNHTPELKVVSMNSLYYDTKNFFQVNTSDRDTKITNSQFSWIKTQFVAARAQKQKVLFLNHIPFLGGESNGYMNRNLGPILQDNQDILLANTNGHSHRSRFILYKKDGKFVSSALITPSIYTDNKYPSFRVYNYTNGVLDFSEYFCNLTKIIEREKFECEYRYSFLQEYGLNNTDLPNLVDLYERMKRNGTLLNTYISHYSPPQFDTTFDYLSEIVNEY